MSTEAQFAKLQAMSPAARLVREGGQAVVWLPAFSFVAAGKAAVMDLLLIPWAHEGYPTRVFFERAITERGQNWKEHYMVQRKWWAPSWNYVLASLPWTAMLCAHLRAVA